MSRVRVKICGLTRREDAELAVALGADAVGFVFWASSARAITATDAAAMTAALPPFVTRVGVFVNASPGDVAAVSREAGLDAVQLHGDEHVDHYRAIGRRIIRGISLEDDRAVAAAIDLAAGVMPLVDAFDGRLRGGTGRTADWSRAALLARRRPIVLAGGLTDVNVGEAIRVVRPWGVDVSSGVEATRGVKSPERLRAFFAAVKAATSEDE